MKTAMKKVGVEIHRIYTYIAGNFDSRLNEKPLVGRIKICLSCR